jgi:hypothetical protein
MTTSIHKLVTLAFILSVPLTTVAQVKAPPAEDAGLVERRTLNEAELPALDASQLVALYDEILHSRDLWKTGEWVKVERAIRSNRDPKMDAMLIALFGKLHDEDARQGNLNHLGGKRVGTLSEAILNVIGARGTRKCVEFVVSQATNEHPVIRGAVARALTPDTLCDPQNEWAITKVMPLFLDSDPDVAARTVYNFIFLFRQKKRLVSPVLARGLIEANKRTGRGVKVMNDLYDLKESFEEGIQAYEQLLKKQSESSPRDERESIDKVREILKQVPRPKETHD